MKNILTIIFCLFAGIAFSQITYEEDYNGNVTAYDRYGNVIGTSNTRTDGNVEWHDEDGNYLGEFDRTVDGDKVFYPAEQRNSSRVNTRIGAGDAQIFRRSYPDLSGAGYAAGRRKKEKRERAEELERIKREQKEFLEMYADYFKTEGILLDSAKFYRVLEGKAYLVKIADLYKDRITIWFYNVDDTDNPIVISAVSENEYRVAGNGTMDKMEAEFVKLSDGYFEFSRPCNIYLFNKSK